MFRAVGKEGIIFQGGRMPLFYGLGSELLILAPKGKFLELENQSPTLGFVLAKSRYQEKLSHPSKFPSQSIKH